LQSPLFFYWFQNLEKLCIWFLCSSFITFLIVFRGVGRWVIRLVKESFPESSPDLSPPKIKAKSKKGIYFYAWLHLFFFTAFFVSGMDNGFRLFNLTDHCLFLQGRKQKDQSIVLILFAAVLLIWHPKNWYSWRVKSRSVAVLKFKTPYGLPLTDIVCAVSNFFCNDKDTIECIQRKCQVLLDA
jgi:hypothetical protein